MKFTPGLLADITLMVATLPGPPAQRVAPRPPPRRPYNPPPTMQTASEREIAEWNKAVEAKRLKKKHSQ